MKVKYIAISLSFLLLSIGHSPRLKAQNYDPATIALQVSGEVRYPLKLTLEQLKSFPTHQVTVKDKKGNPHLYTGVYVQDILTKAGVTTGQKLKGDNLIKYVLADCSDGYQELYSLAELDSSFTKHPPIVAFQIDGQALFESRGPLRMVMPEDKKPARSCYKLTSLQVHFAKK